MRSQEKTRKLIDDINDYMASGDERLYAVSVLSNTDLNLTVWDVLHNVLYDLDEFKRPRKTDERPEASTDRGN